jgi:hypothetical protein
VFSTAFGLYAAFVVLVATVRLRDVVTDNRP